MPILSFLWDQVHCPLHPFCSHQCERTHQSDAFTVFNIIDLSCKKRSRSYMCLSTENFLHSVVGDKGIAGRRASLSSLKQNIKGNTACPYANTLFCHLVFSRVRQIHWTTRCKSAEQDWLSPLRLRAYDVSMQWPTLSFSVPVQNITSLSCASSHQDPCK